jgi:hypothetical protein
VAIASIAAVANLDPVRDALGMCQRRPKADPLATAEN